MIDYLKILIKDTNPAILETNPLLEFFDNINLKTGEIKTTNRKGNKVMPYKTANYRSLEFRIYDNGKIYLSGSLHKYWNSGAHNFNDFDYNSFLFVLTDLNTKFGLVIENCILKCLEVGINIKPPISTNHFLDYCFLHKTSPFEYIKNSNEGKYKQVQHSQYVVKIYNKALHYSKDYPRIEGEIMRFEIKYIKMQKLNNKGIFNLNELKNYGLNNFKNDLIIEFKNILFFDTTITSKSNSLTNYKNPLFWTGLLSEKKNDLFKYHKTHLNEITLKTSQNIQQKTIEIISLKIELLTKNTTRIYQFSETPNTTQIDPLIILSNQVVCTITKLNISMQKNNSNLLSHTGLKYYYKNDRKTFNQIRKKYLSENWINSDFETQIKEIAHNIRNAKSNQTIKLRSIYKPYQTNLLNQFTLI